MSLDFYIYKGGVFFMTETFVTFFGVIMSSVTAIAVAAIGYFQAKSNKKQEEYNRLREENERIVREQEEQRKHEEEERLLRIEAKIETISSEVVEIKSSNNMANIEKQLNKLHTLNAMNFEYIQSISNAVCALGESISTSESLTTSERKKLESGIAAHKEKENHIVEKLYNIVV